VLLPDVVETADILTPDSIASLQVEYFFSSMPAIVAIFGDV